MWANHQLLYYTHNMSYIIIWDTITDTFQIIPISEVLFSNLILWHVLSFFPACSETSWYFQPSTKSTNLLLTKVSIEVQQAYRTSLVNPSVSWETETNKDSNTWSFITSTWLPSGKVKTGGRSLFNNGEASSLHCTRSSIKDVIIPPKSRR